MMKIFVSRQGGIGDVILATPVLCEIKCAIPDSFITLMTFPNAREIVEGLPFIDEVFCYEKQKDGFIKLWKKLKGNDIAIFLDLSYRPALASALALVPLRVGIEHKRKFWLTKALKWHEYMDHTYEPYNLKDIVNEALNINIECDKLNKPFIAPANENDKADLIKKLSAAGLKSNNYLVSSPITAYFLKNWPLERWNELYARLYNEYGLQTVVFGGGSSPYSWEKNAVVDLYGCLNLRQAGELIKNATLLINSCSMPIHIAAATDTPSVVMYGYGDPKRWAPRENCHTIVTKLSCSPCDGYYGSKCTSPKCMQEMTIDEVFAACCEQLNLR